MKETKFTNGPWVNVGGWVDAESKGGGVICSLSAVDRKSEAESDANANLISAAPELYEALVTAAALYQIIIDMGRTEYKELLDQANSVLSKARGE